MATIKSYTDLEQSKKKELSIEQKAQAYDEVVKKLKGFMVQGVDPLITRADVQDFFPELKESEDEKIRKEILTAFSYGHDNSDIYGHGITYGQVRAWLEKQGEQNLANSAKTCKDEQKPAWSEEDENGLSDALWAIQQASTIAKDENDMGNVWYAEHWLKSLKERVQPQPKQEWSEEDERIRIETIELLETANHPNVLHRNGKPLDFTENINWLKSLRPQNWKPSEEQIKALKEAVDEHFDIDGGALWHLYEDLKKLKE